MKRYLPFLSVLLFAVVMLMTVESMAQTIMTDKPTPQKLYEVLLKVLFPVIWTAVSPWLTGLVTAGFKVVPPSIQVIISSVFGCIMAGITGLVPDFPLSPESAATMGVSAGATGQLLANMNPAALQPKVGTAAPK